MHVGIANQFQFFKVDDEIVPNLRPEKDIWNLSNDEFYESKTKTEKTRGSLHALLQVSRVCEYSYFCSHGLNFENF